MSHTPLARVAMAREPTWIVGMALVICVPPLGQSLAARVGGVLQQRHPSHGVLCVIALAGALLTGHPAGPPGPARIAALLQRRLVVHVAARRRGRSRAGRPVFVRLATAVPAALAVLLFSAEPVAVPRP